MALRNTDKTYGSLAKWFHWISALTIFGLFGLGLWMRTLGYYDEWYQTAPNIHKSIGILLVVLILARLVWRWINPQPHDPTHKPIERFAATWTHRIFYVLLLGMFVAGYLISTSDGRALEVFNLFSIPSVYQKTGLEAQAGLVHEYMAYGIIALAVLHIAGALKHHVIDKDQTLTRMLPGSSNRKSETADLQTD